MLKIIRDLLQSIINNIDSGNSSMTQEECIEVIDTLKKFTDKTEYISKWEAYTILGISRATFDNYVRAGRLPKGIKKSGFKELVWIKKDILNFKNSLDLKS